MRAMFAFGLGAAVGAVLAFHAGRRFEAARIATRLAIPYVGVARERVRAAAGGVITFAVVIAAGAIIMIFA